MLRFDICAPHDFAIADYSAVNCAYQHGMIFRGITTIYIVLLSFLSIPAAFLGIAHDEFRLTCRNPEVLKQPNDVIIATASENSISAVLELETDIANQHN